MAILKELWTNAHLDEDTKTTYTRMLQLRRRLERTCALAHEELEKTKTLQKRYYNKKDRKRELFPGDQVLEFLPANTNKLVLSWKGPFPVIERCSKRNYLVNLGDKVTLFHINMLKNYEEHKPLRQQMTARSTMRSRVYYNRRRKPHSSGSNSPLCFLYDRPFAMRCNRQTHS